MSDSSRARRWLKPQPHSSNAEITIDCFPYGIAQDTSASLDLMEEVSSRSLWTIYSFLVLTVIVVTLTAAYCFFPTLILNYFTYVLKSPKLLWDLMLLSTCIFVITIGVAFNENPLTNWIKRRNLISHSLFKIKTLSVSERGLYFILVDQDPISLPWGTIENIKLSPPKDNKTKKLALELTGSRLKEPVPIALASLHTQENWLLLKQAVHNFAPQITIDEQIGSAFSIPSLDTSFTDIWLDSLGRAPEENSLISLPAGLNLYHQKYVILTQLASGGQGHAYLAKETASGKEVVIKEYLLPIYQNKEIKDKAIKELEAEALVLQRINHPKIVQFLNWFTEADRAFLVLNHVDGHNLKAWIKRNGLPSPALIQELAKQMCEILTYLHSYTPPIIHRDFTPDNLIIDEKNYLTLIDFTIAEPTGVSSGLPPSGKPAYMPPEQFRGESSVQSDIYALGGTLYFLTTGQDPVALEQPSDQENIGQPLLWAIIQKCRAQLSEDRYRNAQEIKTLLSPAQ